METFLGAGTFLPIPMLEMPKPQPLADLTIEASDVRKTSIPSIGALRAAVSMGRFAEDLTMLSSARAYGLRWLIALTRSGVELWEMTGPSCLHTKAAVIDGETVIVGSFNLDPRSEHLNTELAMVFTDRDRAGDLLAVLEDHLEQAVRIDRDGRPEGSRRRYPGVSTRKILKLQLLRLISPLIKKQL